MFLSMLVLVSVIQTGTDFTGGGNGASVCI